MRLCKINDNYIEFNMCSLSKPRFIPRNSYYLGRGRGKIMNTDGTTSNRWYYFYYIHYKNFI